MTRSSTIRIVLASGALAIGALAGASGVVLFETAGAGASTASVPSFCLDVALLPNSPSEVASHWPTLSNSPTQLQELDVTNALSVLEPALGPGNGTGPAPLLKALRTAETAAYEENSAVNYLNPGFNISHTKAAIAGYLSTVHRQAAIASRALTGVAMEIKQLCRSYVGTSVAQQDALHTATYSASMPNAAFSPTGPSRSDILAGAARTRWLHAAKVLAITPSSGTVTRVKYGVPVIYRTYVVCVAFVPLKAPSVVAC
jgi:hypothetical protein